MKRAVLIIGIVLIAGAYVAGLWPERQRARVLQEQATLLEQRASAAESRLRVSEILGHLLALEDAIEARNFGDAAGHASRYFDRVAAEAPRADRPEVKKALEDLLQSRDSVTAALARTEPGVLEVLLKQELALRLALGYPVGQ